MDPPDGKDFAPSAGLYLRIGRRNKMITRTGNWGCEFLPAAKEKPGITGGEGGRENVKTEELDLSIFYFSCFFLGWNMA